MDAGLIDLMKIWGPLSIGWVAAIYMGKFIMDRYDKDIESRSKLASALDALTSKIEDVKH